MISMTCTEQCVMSHWTVCYDIDDSTQPYKPSIFNCFINKKIARKPVPSLTEFLF